MDYVDTVKQWFHDRYEEDKLFFIFCAVSSVFLLFFIILMFITNGDALFNILGTTHEDYFEDYFYSVLASSYYPYSLERVIYPPLITVMYAIVGTVTMKFVDVPLGDAMNNFPILRDSQMGMMSYFLITAIVIYVLYTMCLHRECSTKTKIIFFFFVTSYPMVFSLERGNNIPIVLIFTFFYVMFYRSENKTLRFLALFALSIAAAIKIYPIIMIALSLREKDYKGMVWCFLITVVLYIVPFLFTDGNPMMLLENLSLNSEGHLKYPGLTGVHKYLMSPLVGIVPDVILSVTGYIIAAILGIIFLVIVMKDDRMDDWKMILLVICVMTFAPSIATTEYMMVFLLIPVIYFFERKREFGNLNIIYTLLLALGLVLIAGIKIPFLPYNEQTILAGMKSVMMDLLLLLTFVEGCIDIYRIRKEKASTDSDD